jgi:hypothetical protein
MASNCEDGEIEKTKLRDHMKFQAGRQKSWSAASRAYIEGAVQISRFVCWEGIIVFKVYLFNSYEAFDDLSLKSYIYDCTLSVSKSMGNDKLPYALVK